MEPDWEAGGFGIYVHWPFCEALCPYCDFNSYVAQTIDHKRWAAAYLSELERIYSLTGPRPLTSIFFGGGTPSLMSAATVEAVISKATSLWRARNTIEITLEANPSSVEAAKFRDFQVAGVNRISIGVQALNDPDLKALGRLHNAKEAVQAIDIAREIYPAVSLDLIYGRQDQTLAQWQAELSQALEWDPDHLSLYQLTIEEGTAFGRRHAAGKLPGLPSEGLGADLYAATQDLCQSAGLPAYEVSNHAKPGAASEHNLIYWRSGDWAGIGPGAHSRLTLGSSRIATDTHLAPGKWLAAANTGSGDHTSVQLTPNEHAEELLMMGMRLSEGVDLDRLERIAPVLRQDKVAELQELGLLWQDCRRIKATPKGRLLLNAILKELLV